MPLWPARLTWDRVHLVNGSYLCQPAGIRVVSNCHGQTNWRLVRYADFVVLVHGNRLDAETLRTEVAGVLARMVCACRWRNPGGQDRRGLRLSRFPLPAARETRHEQTLRLHLPVQESGHRDQGLGAHFDAQQHASRPDHPAGTRHGVLRGWADYVRHGVSNGPSARPRPTPLGSPRSARRRDPPGTRVLDVRGSPGWIGRRRNGGLSPLKRKPARWLSS